MEPDDEFERRAFSAAGPVFLVAIGALMLLVAVVAALLGGMSAGVALFLGGGGLAALVGGFVWGATQNQRSAARRRSV